MAMDSGNNNNIESSSVGLDEFGSLLLPPFLNPSSSTHFNHPPTFFELSSSRSILCTQGLGQVPIPTSTPMQPRLVDDVNGVSVPKNPKKRTRESRKAPTTILTTDTTNFRAMVQEFTGIPAPPFSQRLDLFGSASLGIRSGHLEALPNKRIQPASTQLLNSIPLVEASNMLNLQNQMVQSLSQGITSVPASGIDEFGLSDHLNGNWKDGVRFNDGSEDHMRPFDGFYGHAHNINT